MLPPDQKTLISSVAEYADPIDAHEPRASTRLKIWNLPTPLELIVTTTQRQWMETLQELRRVDRETNTHDLENWLLEITTIDNNGLTLKL